MELSYGWGSQPRLIKRLLPIVLQGYLLDDAICLFRVHLLFEIQSVYLSSKFSNSNRYSAFQKNSVFWPFMKQNGVYSN